MPGKRLPGMGWEPEASFHALAAAYAGWLAGAA
jgi:hypothetical protein